MAFVQRLPLDPDAIDIGAIHRREQLKVWHRKREAPAEQSLGWMAWLKSSWSQK